MPSFLQNNRQWYMSVLWANPPSPACCLRLTSILLLISLTLAVWQTQKQPQSLHTVQLNHNIILQLAMITLNIKSSARVCVSPFKNTDRVGVFSEIRWSSFHFILCCLVLQLPCFTPIVRKQEREQIACSNPQLVSLATSIESAHGISQSVRLWGFRSESGVPTRPARRRNEVYTAGADTRSFGWINNAWD